MTDETATSIASGVGPLFAALIAAYQLWLKPKVDEPRELPFDLIRLHETERTIRKIRLQVALFTLFVIGVTLIPATATIGSVIEINLAGSVSLPKVLVAFVASVGVVHSVYMVGRLRAVISELNQVSARAALQQKGSP
jgi:hypothetical protein